MAAAAHVGLRVPRTHPAKADAAEELARRYGIPDVSDLLRELNTARKASAYGDTDFPDLDAEEVASELETFLESVMGLMK